MVRFPSSMQRYRAYIVCVLCTEDQPSRYRARETAPARARHTIIKAYSRTTKQDPRGGPPAEPTATADIPTTQRHIPKTSIERYFATFKRWVENYKLHIFYLSMFFLVTAAIFVERAYCEFVLLFVCATYVLTYFLHYRLLCGARKCWIASYCWIWCYNYTWCCVMHDVDLLHPVAHHGPKLHHLPQRDPLQSVRPLRHRCVLPQDHSTHCSVLHCHALCWTWYQFLPHCHSDIK